MSLTLRIPSDEMPGSATAAAAQCLTRFPVSLRFRHGAMSGTRATHPDARARLWQSENRLRGWPRPTASRVRNSFAQLKRLLLCTWNDAPPDALFLFAGF